MLRRLITDVAKLTFKGSNFTASSGSVSRPLVAGAAVQGSCLANIAYSTDFRATLLNSSPKSLATERVYAEPQPGVEQNFLTKALLRIGGYYSKESRLLRASKAWYECVTEQVEDSRLYKAFGLEENFANKYALLSIHIWLCLVRLRSEGKEGKELAQLLYENFTDDVEIRVRAAGVKVRISKHLMDLEQMFYGTSLSYDQALDDKEDLSAAVLRNVFANKDERRRDSELLARYMTRELACLSMTSSDAIMAGSVSFSREILK